MNKESTFAFDRDGTLIWGNPPGPIVKEHLLQTRKLGYDIGGSGGQPSDEQYSNWKNNGIKPDFTVYKPELSSLKKRYVKVTQVGDDILDKKIAADCGFDYMTPEQFVSWIRKKIANSKRLGY